MTIMRGGMLRNITIAMHAIAAAVTAIVIAGQLLRRRSLAAMQPYFSFSRLLLRRTQGTPKDSICPSAQADRWGETSQPDVLAVFSLIAVSNVIGS